MAKAYNMLNKFVASNAQTPISRLKILIFNPLPEYVLLNKIYYNIYESKMKEPLTALFLIIIYPFSFHVCIWVLPATDYFTSEAPEPGSA